MRGEGRGRLELGAYDGGHIGPSFFSLQNNCGFMTNMVSLGDKVFILQFSRFLWRCGTARQPTARALSLHQGLRNLQASRTSRSLLWRCGHKRPLNSVLALIAIFFLCAVNLREGRSDGRSPVPKVTIAVFTFALFTGNGILWKECVVLPHLCKRTFKGAYVLTPSGSLRP
ncbi:hypothetical protein TNCV_1545201 [Trichonephila clavipes]|nr:hypothetical protein TNCV_1545201 [Trichonephila clavipes]